MSQRLPSAALNTENNGVAGTKIGGAVGEEAVVRTAPDEGDCATLFLILFLVGRLLDFDDIAG